MSVEAPNNHKFQSILSGNIPQKNPSGSRLFEQLFNTQLSRYSSTVDDSPKSPKDNTVWMEYSSGSEQNVKDACQKMITLKQDGLLKFSNIEPHQQGLKDALKCARTTPIKHLIVQRSVLSDAHLQAVANVLKINDGIAWLVLNHNKIDNRGIRHLTNGIKENKGLNHVVLSHNEIGDEGAMALSAALEGHPHVESVWLRGNNISDAQCFIQMIKNNQKIRSLDLRDNQLSIKEIQSIQQICKEKGVRLYA